MKSLPKRGIIMVVVFFAVAFFGIMATSNNVAAAPHPSCPGGTHSDCTFPNSCTTWINCDPGDHFCYSPGPCGCQNCPPQPPPPGGGGSGWGGCGSCSGCMGDNQGQCRACPSGCCWDPSGCGSPPCNTTFPGSPSLVSPVDKANVVGAIGGSVAFSWTLAGWGNGCPNNNQARIMYGLKTQATCGQNQITWSSGGLGTATTGTRPITGADPYLKLNTTYCWGVNQNNGSLSRNSVIREFTLIPSVQIDSAVFATPTKCGGQRISGSAIYPDTNNPITYTVDVTHPLNNFSAGINYLKEVNLAMVPNTTLNSVTSTNAIAEPRFRDYLGFKVTGLGTYPNNIQYMTANNATVPVWANPQSSGNLTNAIGRATLLGLGTQTTVTQLNNTTLRVTFTIRFEDTFPTVPVLNSYVMAVMNYEGVDYSQDIVGANRFYYRRFETWRTDLQSPAVSVVGPTTISATPPSTFRITWGANDTNTGNTGISLFSGTCRTGGSGGTLTDPWTTGAAGGTPRRMAVSVEHNNKIYVWGGCNAVGSSCASPFNTMDVYDIATNTWSTGTAGGVGRYGATAEVYNNKMYIWGGHTGAAYSNRMDIFDFNTNTWSTGLAGGGVRAWATSSIYNDRMYIFGGYTGAAYTQATSYYNITTNTWANAATSPTYAHAAEAVFYNNKFYIWGGYTNATTNIMRIYDPVTNAWSTGAAGGNARYIHTASLSNGKIYIYGGCPASGCGTLTNSLSIYDIATNTWTITTTPGPTAKAGHRAEAKNGKLYVLHGTTSWAGTPAVNTVDIFDIAAGQAIDDSGSIVQITQTSSPVTSFELLGGVETQCLYVTDYTNEGLLGNKLYRQDSTAGWNGITIKLNATDGACNSPTATVSIDDADPWTMVRYGAASAGGGFNGFTIPDINMSTLYPGSWGDEAFLSAHSTISGSNNMISGRQSAIDTYTSQYNDLNTDPANILGMSTWYDTINKILSDRYPTGITNLTANTVPANLNTYPAGQTAILRYTPTGGTLSTVYNGGNSFTCTRPAIILVNGNFTINPNMFYSTEDTKCVWVVKGNVTVNTGVDYNPLAGGTATNSDAIRGNVIITDGTFNVLADDQNASTYADSLWAWPVIARAVNLQRDMGGFWNARYPSEFFQFDPSILYFLSDELAVTKFSIRPR